MSGFLSRFRGSSVLLLLACITASACFLLPLLQNVALPRTNTLCRRQESSFGLFLGDSLESLQPVDFLGMQGIAAWPLANPVMTSLTLRSFDSIASPHLWVADGRLLLVFELISCQDGRRAIGVAESFDEGTTWKLLGASLGSHKVDALRKPQVLVHNGEVFMVTDSSYGPKLYRSTSFPMGWHFNSTLSDKPIRGPSIHWHHPTQQWLLTGSVPARGRMTAAGGTKREDHALAMYAAPSPMGPWAEVHGSPFRVAAGSPGGGLYMVPGVEGSGSVFVRLGRECRRGTCSDVHAFAFNYSDAGVEEAPLPGFLGRREWVQKTAWDGSGRSHASLARLPSGRLAAVVEGQVDRKARPMTATAVDMALITTWMVCIVSLAMVMAHAASRLRLVRTVVLRWDVRNGGLTPMATPKTPGSGSTNGSSSSSRFNPQQYSRLWSEERGESVSPRPPNSHMLTSRKSGSMNPVTATLAANLASQFSQMAHELPLAPANSFTFTPVTIPNPVLTPATSRSTARRPPPSTRVRQAVGRLYGTPVRRVVAMVFIAALSAGLALSLTQARLVMAPFWAPAPPEPVGGQFSSFTLMVMSYGARRKLLSWYVHHYSQCPSVGEILIVWNGGPPPIPSTDFPSAPVPVRVRQHDTNSMSNRYQVDPHFRFRAVLSLDDDILMPCSDVEHAFARWRENPDLIVGWYPRLAEGQVYKEGGEWRKRWWYRGEPAAIADGQYNLVLTGAAFLDTRAALPAYWAPQLEEARALVDRLQNCDDLLMNFVVANLTLAAGQGRNASLLPQAVQYMRPSRRIDVSWASGVGLSHAVQHFIDDAEECLGKFSEIFGEVKLRSEVFEWSGTTQPSCSSRDVLQCSYLSD